MSDEATQQNSARTGFIAALTAFVFWGFLPLYFVPLTGVPVVELLAHRIVWAVPMAALVMLAWGRWGEISALFRDWRLVRMMMLTAALIAANWGIYVYSIAANITSQAALGYYITPLMNVALGTLLLGERMTKLQTAAVAIAAVAVLVKAVWAGEVPYIGLALTTSFAVYGYLRKTVPVGATPGFLMEVVLLAPFALAYLLWVAVQGQAAFGTDLTLTALLIGCGPVTAIPLILYAVGARGLRLTTLGLMQYIAPTLIFIVSFTVFGEEFTRVEAVTFALIWTALALYSWSMLRGNGTT